MGNAQIVYYNARDCVQGAATAGTGPGQVPFAWEWRKTGRVDGATHSARESFMRDGKIGLLDAIPDEWGPKHEYDSAAVARTHAGPNTINYTAPAHFALVLFTAQPERQVALNSSRKQVGLAPVGALEIIPQGSEIFSRWEAEKQSLLVAFEGDRLQRLAGVEFDNDSFDLRPPPLGSMDREAHDLAKRMRQELERPGLAHPDCLDALTTLFGIHLLRNYSTLQTRASRQFNGGLSPAAWRRVNDFIQANLSRKLSLEKMAEVAQLSPSHFSRAFHKTAGQSPHQFVISSRLVQAKALIMGTNDPLDEIARASGFSSHSHMTTLMNRSWHVTPAELRRDRPRSGAAPEDDAQG